MVQVEKVKVVYGISYEVKELKAKGEYCDDLRDSIGTMFLEFTEGEKRIGSANYNCNGKTHEGSVNYNFYDESKKSLIVSTAETILSDVQAQIQRA